MNRLDDLVARVKSRHFAYRPVSAHQHKRLQKLGLPPDALRFYQIADGACLHSTTESGGLRNAGSCWWKWCLLQGKALKPVQEMGYVLPDSPLFRRSRFWIGIVDVQDGNYLALNVEPGHAGEIIDCFHETVGSPGYNSIVARGFTELLELLLASPEPFWLDKKHRVHGEY